MDYDNLFLSWFSASNDDWALSLQLIYRLSLIYTFVLVLGNKRLKSRTRAGSDTGMIAITALTVSMGVILQYLQDLGLLPAFLVSCFVLCIHQTVRSLLFAKQHIAEIWDENVFILIEDGKLNLSSMKKAGVLRNILFCTLGRSGIQQLGQVKRLYLEANNSFSIIQARLGIPGLPLEVETLDPCTEISELVCSNCGEMHPGGQLTHRPCPRCYRTCWVRVSQFQ